MALVILKFCNGLLLAYLLLLSMRIVLTWFRGAPFGKAWDLLCSVTEPYLSQFYRIRLLRREVFDFTPIAAILVLVVALNLVNTLIYYGQITLGLFLASVLLAAWSAVSFLLLLFLIIGIVRVAGIFLHGRPSSNVWHVVDLLIQPVVKKVMKLIALGQRAGYTQYLFLTIGFLFAAWLLGGYIVRQLANLLVLLPV